MNALLDKLGIEFYCAIGAPATGKYIVYGLNTVYNKRMKKY